MRKKNGFPDEKKVALVTGATSGIGYELAKVLAREGYALVLVARDGRRLGERAREFERSFGTPVRILPMDLSLPQGPARIFQRLRSEGVAVDVLVNNAGFGTNGPFLKADLESQAGMIALNVAALTRLTRLFLPGMAERGSGKILNVASTAAFQPGPMMAVYYATKAYVLSFSEALAEELSGTGVTVTALCPGPTATEFSQRANMKNSRLFSAFVMEAAKVAEIGYRAMLRGRPVVVAGLRNRLGAFSVRFSPRGLVAKIVRKLNEPRTWTKG